MNLDAMLRDDGYRTETLRGRRGEPRGSLPRNLNIFLAGRSRNLALESRGIIISVNILLSSSSLLFNSKSKFKLSLHSLFLFFSPQFFPLHPPQPDYISSRFDRVSGWEYHRRGSNDALMTEERRTASDRLWVRECRGFGPTFATCGGGGRGSRRNKRDTTGIYDRPPHYYSMNFNAKRTVSRRDTRGGFFAKAKTRGQRRRQKISV